MTSKTRRTDSGIETAEATVNAIGSESVAVEGAVTQILCGPVDAWLRCQASMLKAIEPAAANWIERRRDAANATLDAWEKLASCNDLNELAAIQRGWLDGAMKRFDADLHALADHAAALSHEAMSATRHAAQTSSEVVGMIAAPILRQQETVEQAA